MTASACPFDGAVGDDFLPQPARNINVAGSNTLVTEMDRVSFTLCRAASLSNEACCVERLGQGKRPSHVPMIGPVNGRARREA